MDKLLQQFWDEMKGKGKGKQNKKAKTTKMNPWKRLTIASAKLSLSNSKHNRQSKADMTNTAFFTNLFPEAFKEAIDTTIATRGTDKRAAAKATWLALCKGIVGSKKAQGVKDAFATLQQHFANPVNIDRHVIECRASITFDQTMLKVGW